MHTGKLRKKMNHFKNSWHRHVYKMYDNVDTNLWLNSPPIWWQGKAGMNITDVWHMSDWPLTLYDVSWLRFSLRMTQYGVGQFLLSVMTSDMQCDSVTQPILWDIEFVLSTTPIQYIFCNVFHEITADSENIVTTQFFAMHQQYNIWMIY